MIRPVPGKTMDYYKVSAVDRFDCMYTKPISNNNSLITSS